MSDNITPSGLLTRASEILTQHGWTQGIYGSESTGYCALGALGAACFAPRFAPTGESLVPGEVYDAAIAQLKDLVEARYGHRSVLTWNDTSGRTRDEVIATFHEAASIAATREATT